MAFLNNPFAKGETQSAFTLDAPADSPAMVILFTSPPKDAMLAFPHIEEKHMYFVSKSGYEDSVIRHAAEEGAILLGLEDLFND